MRNRREHIDLLVYVRALGVLARNPTAIVVPLLVAVIGVFVGQISAASGGGVVEGLTGGITAFVMQLLGLFALGVAIIIGDAGWRRGFTRFDDAWQDARRKSGDILFAAFGFTFVLTIAQYAAGLIGSVGIVLIALAVYGLVYTIAASAIGGVPGNASITVSIERVKSAPLTAAILTVVAVVLLLFFRAYVGIFIDTWLADTVGSSELIGELIDAFIQAILTGYLGVVMAKVYSDVSFTVPR
jgi:hypothetical protein